jgi:hypothetical protein
MMPMTYPGSGMEDKVLSFAHTLLRDVVSRGIMSYRYYSGVYGAMVEAVVECIVVA